MNYLDRGDLSELKAGSEGATPAEPVSGGQELPRQHSSHVLDKIHRRIDAPRPIAGERIWMFRRAMAVAAMVIVLAGAGYFLWQVMMSRANDKNLARDGWQGTGNMRQV